MEAERGKLPPPPGLIASLAAGFDSVANHITVITLPLLFDLFLWFGPRLRLETLRPSLMAFFTLLIRARPAEEAPLLHARAETVIQSINLFSALRTFPVGTPSLLSTLLPIENPLGTPLLLDAGSFTDLLGWLGTLVLCGWIAGAIYLQWVSRVALQPGKKPAGRAILQALLLSFLLVAAALFLGAPLMLIFGATSVVNPLLAKIMQVLAFTIALWLAAPIFFSVHGIFTFQMDAVRALFNSLRMTRFTLPATTLFLLLMILISAGLDTLWRTPTPDSWWLLVGLAGHAFISTALIAASFIYYRDVNSWLKVVFDQLKAQTNSVKI
jgi:hypothetical protein